MSNIEWYLNEMELVNDFLNETEEDIKKANTLDNQISQLQDEILELEQRADSEEEKVQIKSKEQSKEDSTKQIIQVLGALQIVKENYLAEGLVDTIETLIATEEGEAIGDKVCATINRINSLMRKYQIPYI